MGEGEIYRLRRISNIEQGISNIEFAPLFRTKTSVEGIISGSHSIFFGSIFEKKTAFPSIVEDFNILIEINDAI